MYPDPNAKNNKLRDRKENKKMKHLKKLGSVLLALVMVMALAMPAFAANDPVPVINGADKADASITIDIGTPEGGTNNATYTYYQMLRASIGADGKTVSYYLLSADATTKTALEGLMVGEKVLFAFTESADKTRWNVTLNAADATGEQIAAALETVKEKAIISSTMTEGEDGNPTATGLDKGYYLITSTLGTNLVLDTLGHETIKTKNEYITNEKTASTTNMNVGDTVTYTIKVHIPAAAVVGDTVTVHDTLDVHLKIVDLDSIAAKVGETTVKLSDGEKESENETFAKSFKITEGMLGKDVILTYDAELLSTAADNTGYVNEVFTNTPTYETNTDQAEVWTFDFDLDKNFSGAEGDSSKIAKFELADSKGNKIEFVKDNTGYVKADSDDTDKTTTLEVNGEDTINIRGLAAGEYTLTEIETADGYNLLKDPVTVIITDTTNKDTTPVVPSHTVSYKVGDGELQENVENVEILNNAGTELPSTGGIGTTIFYIVGGILVLGAVVLLITKRRTSVDDE